MISMRSALLEEVRKRKGKRGNLEIHAKKLHPQRDLGQHMLCLRSWQMTLISCFAFDRNDGYMDSDKLVGYSRDNSITFPEQYL